MKNRENWIVDQNNLIQQFTYLVKILIQTFRELYISILIDILSNLIIKHENSLKMNYRES